MLQRVLESQQDAIRAHAMDKYPFECCGVITADTGEIVRCDNLAENKSQHFVIGRHAFARLERYRGIAAVYHSHINQGSNPSTEDKDNAPWLAGKTYIIVSVIGGIAQNPRVYYVGGDGKLRRYGEL